MSTKWQDKLEDKCRESRIQAPSYQEFSDRRGGRTAWHSCVAFGQFKIVSRFAYNGENINNAREDAAERALLEFFPDSGSDSRMELQSRHGSTSTWSQ